MKANEFLQYKNWVVVGDVLNRFKYAYKILSSLREADFNVVGLNPSVKNEEAYKSLADIPYKIDILNLCINPIKGIKILQDAHKLKIDKVLIQPGAESSEILDFCRQNGIEAIEGCTLVELRKR
ncbi:MAG: CoA-binding protein [Clostridium sp.]|uniref:CoA-binding protein n=1 Tax=Clostridium sp. TaxID=1506 RepID=UPI003D6DA5CD